MTNGKTYIESVCLSIDTKATQNIVNGSLCLEMDTGKLYAYDEEGDNWDECVESGSTPADVLPSVSSADNGKVLTVVDGVWNKADNSGGSSAAVQNLAVRVTDLDGIVTDIQLELGNITISTSGWAYANSTKRIRTKQGTTVSLKAGSTIAMLGQNGNWATGYRMYIGYKKTDNTYGLQGWLTSAYTCPFDGEYVILMSAVTEVDESDNLAAYESMLNVINAGALKYTAADETKQMGYSIDLWKKFLPGLGLNGTTGKYTESGNTRLNIASPITLTEQVYFYGGTDIYVAYQTRNNDNTIAADSGWKTGMVALPVNTPFTLCLKKGSGGTTNMTPEDILNETAFFKLDVQNPLVIQTFRNKLENAVSRSNFRGVAHRGYNNIAPENTMAAFKEAKKFGFAWVETDIRKTSDGQFVLLHDASINATARNADGTSISETVNIADITYEQALTYDFGIAKGQQYAGEKIPLLSEFLAFCKGSGLNAYLELKLPYSQTDVNAIVAMVAKYNMQDRVVYMYSSSTQLGYIKTAYPKANLCYLPTALPTSADALTVINGLKNDVNEVSIAINRTWSASDLISAMNEANVPVDVYTVDSWVFVPALKDTTRSFITNRLFWLEEALADIADEVTGTPII